MAEKKATGRWRHGRSRDVPFLGLILYYTVLLGLAALAIRWVPAIEHALLSPIDGGAAESIFREAPPVEAVPRTGRVIDAPEPERALTTMIVMLGAVLLAAPTAWVYMYTRRLRYDPSLVQSIVILPLVVAGIVIIVKNSLALAFSLAGIVAVVRFRNTLKDPKDAVYVFLTLGVGLAAGVQALDIAFAMSLGFNILVLGFWKWNFGSIYSGVSPKLRVLSVGNGKLLTVRKPEDRERIKALVGDAAAGMETDGVLLVHTHDPEAAHRALELSLNRLASEWRLLGTEMPGRKGSSTLAVVLDLMKKVDPAELLGEIDERWSPHIAAAEFVSLRTHEVSWDGRDRRGDEDDDD